MYKPINLYDMEGKTATLKKPYRGYSRIRIIEKIGYKWLVKLESGLEIEVYEDEFILD